LVDNSRQKIALVPIEQQVWPLPEDDYWSTPFAKMLLHHLELFPGASVLDIASGHGTPAFHIAEQVGPNGLVLGLDLHPAQILRCKTTKGPHLPWLNFAQADMRALPEDIGTFDRITGNIAFMFFRPERFLALKQLVGFLKPGGQIVLTFPALGTFDSIWQRVDKEMAARRLKKEQAALQEYIAERPSADEVRQWLTDLKMDRIEVNLWPLEIKSGPGRAFLEHPLLRGGFLEDAYECFEDQALANEVMDTVAADLESFTPLLAERCAFSAWRPEK
jgi:ubiquinone/menaquinone biosynthesis C-methylase UbiE